MAELIIPWKFIIAVVLAIILLMIFVIFRGQVFEAVGPMGKGIINALNDIVAGRPPWLK